MGLRITQMTPAERMRWFDTLPRAYRDIANEHGLAAGMARKVEDDEFAAFEAEQEAFMASIKR